VGEGVLDGFALGIEHRLFWRNNDFSFHKPETGKLSSKRKRALIRRKKRGNLV
jgi:hypothetical protein